MSAKTHLHAANRREAAHQQLVAALGDHFKGTVFDQLGELTRGVRDLPVLDARSERCRDAAVRQLDALRVAYEAVIGQREYGEE